MKTTIPLLKTQKGMRMLINALKTLDLAAIPQNQKHKDNAPYPTIMQMGNAIATSMVR
jgi:hypothetical protein